MVEQNWTWCGMWKLERLGRSVRLRFFTIFPFSDSCRKNRRHYPTLGFPFWSGWWLIFDSADSIAYSSKTYSTGTSTGTESVGPCTISHIPYCICIGLQYDVWHVHILYVILPVQRISYMILVNVFPYWYANICQMSYAHAYYVPNVLQRSMSYCTLYTVWNIWHTYDVVFVFWNAAKSESGRRNLIHGKGLSRENFSD